MSRIATFASRLAASALAVACASCSGGHSSVMPAAGRTRTMSAIAFTMHWPTRAGRHVASAVRRPQFISPQTQSVVVEVNADATLSTTANKPAQGAISTVSINAPVGADTITITTWDQPNGAGNLLGQISVTQTIVAGQLNTVNATVDGVLEKIGLSGAPNPFLEMATDATGNPTATLVGSVAQTFTIVPEDVDGDVIVPPGDAPTLSMRSNDASITVTPVTGQTDQYTVQAAFQTSPSSNPALEVSGTDGLGNTVASHFGISESAAIYVGYAGPAGPSIVVYDQLGKVIVNGSAFAGLADASGITYDTKRNRMVIADAALGTLQAFDPQGNADNSFAKPTLTGANAVVYDPDLDRLYVAQTRQGSVIALTGDGAAVTLPGTPFAGLKYPSSVTYNPNYYGASPGPQVFVADSSVLATTQVAAFNPDGSAGVGAMQYSSTDSFTAHAAVYDPNVDYIFVVGDENAGSGPVSTLREFGPNYGNIPMITATAGLNQPSGIAFNPVNREIYVANRGDGTISVFLDRTGSSTFVQDTTTVFTAPGGQTQPKSLAIVF